MMRFSLRDDRQAALPPAADDLLPTAEHALAPSRMHGGEARGVLAGFESSCII
jgi:hypothetical protein